MSPPNVSESEWTIMHEDWWNVLKNGRGIFFESDNGKYPVRAEATFSCGGRNPGKDQHLCHCDPAYSLPKDQKDGGT
jgi:hypothetical protein